MKKFIKNGLILIIFATLLHFILNSFFTTKFIKDLKRSTTFRQFLSQEHNSIDILLLGSSHSYCSLNPLVFKRITGADTFNLGSGAQSFASSYSILKEALKYQKPQIVIQDINFTSYQITVTEIETGIQYFPDFDIVKSEIYSNMPWKDKIKFNVRYLNLELTLYSILSNQIKNSNIKNFLGFEACSQRLTKEEIDNIHSNQQVPFHFTSQFYKNIDYLSKIKQLCEREKIKLVFISSPMVNNAINDESIHFFFRSFFSKNSSTYLDFSSNKLIKFIPENDFRDESHLNIEGAEKISTFLAQFIKNEALLN